MDDFERELNGDSTVNKIRLPNIGRPSISSNEILNSIQAREKGQLGK